MMHYGLFTRIGNTIQQSDVIAISGNLKTQKKAATNMDIYASVAGHYKLGGRILRHLYCFNQQECCQAHTCINT
jgi:hypothetical protein